VTLLLRHILIADQPSVDDRGIRVDRPTWAGRVLLARGRHRRGERLTDRPPMHPMPLGQLPDRQPLDPSIPPYLLKDFHS
jgi:hypothetical protein